MAALPGDLGFCALSRHAVPLLLAELSVLAELGAVDGWRWCWLLLLLHVAEPSRLPAGPSSHWPNSPRAPGLALVTCTTTTRGRYQVILY